MKQYKVYILILIETRARVNNIKKLANRLGGRWVWKLNYDFLLKREFGWDGTHLVLG